MSQRISPSDKSIYAVPFRFVIPRGIPNFQAEVPEHCTQLPPSLELGFVIMDESTGQRFAQPSIAYNLRATVTLNTGGGEGSKTVDTSLPVIITPYTQEYPPTETTDFPMEFNEQETKVLRRYLMGRGLGTMKAFMREPPALIYDVQSASACTEALVKLEVNFESSSEVYQILQNLTFKICPLIRIKTYYSLQSFRRLPSIDLLSFEGAMRFRDEMIKLDSKDGRGVSWKYVLEQSSQAPGTLHPPTLRLFDFRPGLIETR